MNRILYPALFLGIFFIGSCHEPDVAPPMTYTNRAATLKFIICSRGCTQYVLMTEASESASLYITNMPDSLKISAVQQAYVNDELPVIFSGTRSDELQQISVAGANDQPIPAFQAYKIQITALRRR